IPARARSGRADRALPGRGRRLRGDRAGARGPAAERDARRPDADPAAPAVQFRRTGLAAGRRRSRADPRVAGRTGRDAMMIEARDLRHSFGSAAVLRGVDLSGADGEVVGLVGPNGSGKTTVLRILHHSLVPDAGQVLLDGRDLAGFT